MAFNPATGLNMSAPIQRLSDICSGFGYRGATVIRSAAGLMERGLSSFETRTREVLGSQLIQTADILARHKMPPYVVAAGLCHFMPEQEHYPTGFANAIPVMKAFNYLMNLPQPTIPTPSTPRNYQDFIMGWDHFPSTMGTDPRTLFNAHMLRASHQLARLRLQTAGGIELMENPVVEAQIATSTAHFLMRLGMESLAQEMTDLSFSIIDPGSYAQMVSILDMSSSYSERLSFQKYLVSVLEHSLPQRVLTLYPEQPDMGISVSSRMKSVASAYNKIRRSREIADIIGARVVLITPYEIDSIDGRTEVLNSNLSEEEKERALAEYGSAISALFDYKQAFVQIALELGWEERLDRYRDYVTNPRPDNGYQALQCTYTTDKGLNFEVQFRTAGMHRFAELGGASHLHYKLGEGTDSSAIQTADPLTRFRRMLRQTREDSVTYGFLFDGLAPIDRSDITGPFRIELLPGRDRASVIDLLVGAGIERPFNCQNAQRFDQLSGTARTIHPYSPIENGDMVHPIMGAKPGLSSPKVERAIASQAARSTFEAEELCRSLGVSNLEAAKKKGRSIYDNALRAVQSRQVVRVPASRLSGSNIRTLVPETILARKFGFDTFDNMLIVFGAKDSAPEGFEAAIQQLMITLIANKDDREATFVYNRSSGITRCILSIIAGMNVNLARVDIHSDGENTVFTASIGDRSDAFFDRIEDEILRVSEMPVADDAGSPSYQKGIRIRISSKHDRSGMISDIFREFLNRDCLISSVSAPESTEGEFVVEISARFRRGISERSINHFLSSLRSKVPGVDTVEIL